MTHSQNQTDLSDDTNSPSKSIKNKKVPYHFGEKLRKVRENKGYTLKVVAQKAGVSESLVSQIERNHVSPAIDTLLALADVLDINLEFLFEEYRKNRPVQIVRALERLSMNEEDVVYEELSKPDSSDKANSFESYIIKIPVNSHTHRGSYGHLGRELGFILSGKAKLLYENNEYTLTQGDSVSFSAGVPHILENIGDEVLEAFWLVTPAQRFTNQ
ncbi:MAG: helix-turn-helix domain-containing protein [Treponema sp.]|jgi:transcriptional regulator with XRE-family HTH domain|nr:helix-turn-helix domain-containing protein [Treponema sp.]